MVVQTPIVLVCFPNFPVTHTSSSLWTIANSGDLSDFPILKPWHGWVTLEDWNIFPSDLGDRIKQRCLRQRQDEFVQKESFFVTCERGTWI